jgi:DNA-binding transcriptional regulator YhcF (GntR family)
MDMDLDDTSKFPLNERDTIVLNVIEEEDLASFAFEGLKRRLGIHPETLSRTLYRLEDQGIVEKEAKGYRVTSKAKELLKAHSFSTGGSNIHILQTLLPLNIPIQQVVSNLKGKWFGVLRWLGYSKNNESITLKWVTEDGGTIISANFQHGQLIIDAKMLWEENLNPALQGSYQLMGYIAKLISNVGDGSQVAYFNLFDSYRLSA